MSDKKQRRIEFLKQCAEKRSKITLSIMQKVAKKKGMTGISKKNLEQMCQFVVENDLFTEVMIEAGMIDKTGKKTQGKKKSKKLSKKECDDLVKKVDKAKTQYKSKKLSKKKIKSLSKKEQEVFKIKNPETNRPVIFDNPKLKKIVDQCKPEGQRTPKRKPKKSTKKKIGQECKIHKDCYNKNCVGKKCTSKKRSTRKRVRPSSPPKSAPKQKKKSTRKRVKPSQDKPRSAPKPQQEEISDDIKKVIRELAETFNLRDLEDKTLMSQLKIRRKNFERKKVAIKKYIEEYLKEKESRPKPKLKFEKMETAEDGACLFNSANGFLFYEKSQGKKILGDDKTKEKKMGDKMRKRIVRYMDENREKELRIGGLTFQELADFDAFEEVVTFDDYLEEMSDPTTWGSHAEIAAIAEYKKRSVEVYTCQEGVWSYYEEFSYKIPGTKPIYIYYNAQREDPEGGSHFEYLVKDTPRATEDCEVEDMDSDIESESFDISDIDLSDSESPQKSPSKSPEKSPSKSPPKTPTPEKPTTPRPKSSPEPDTPTPVVAKEYTDDEQKKLYELRNKLLNIKEGDHDKLNEIVKELIKINREKVKEYNLDDRKKYILSNLKKIYKKEVNC